MKSKVYPGTYYKMLSWRRYCALKGLEQMPPVGVCCYCDRVGSAYLIVLTDGFNIWAKRDICSEECFNMWLIKEML